jgi:uncharacterized membrane protein
MILFKNKKNHVNNGFQLRGKQMTRLETFIDAAFAFATTMLVISIGDIPENFTELIFALKQIPSCLSSFIIIMLFWNSHRTWSRRYGLEDKSSTIISVILVFVLLTYIYPLRIVFSALFSWLSKGWFPSLFILNSQHELSGLFIIYGLGMLAMGGLMVLLYLQAKKKKNILRLNQLELNRTDLEITSFSAVALTGLASVLFTWRMPSNINVLGGFIYITLPFTLFIIDWLYKKKERKFTARRKTNINSFLPKP